MQQRILIDRRLVLKAAAASAAVMAIPGTSVAATSADAILLTISDLHAPYARLPMLLSRIRALKAEAGSTSMAMLINGDVFERGNVVCLRSGGVCDMAFLKAVASEMPVVVNLGNHETAIYDDMQIFTANAAAAGVEVISNLIDSRTGRFYAPVSTRLGLGGIDLSLLGIAATNPFVYRKPVRGNLSFLTPANFVADAFAGARGDADTAIIMSHAGVTPDRAYIDTLPAGTILQGAHDHLTFDTVRKDVTYFHGASWGTKLGILELTRGADGVAVKYRAEDIPVGEGDAELADLIAAQKAEHLTDEDTAVIAEIGEDRDLHQSILIATEAIRSAADADVAVIGHTTFGAPLSKGAFTKYDLDAFIRFGGGLSMAEMSGETLAGILMRANQFKAATLEERTGDYVHVAEVDVDPAKTYRFVTNAWTGMNQESYLGTTGLEFQTVPDLELKAVVAGYLAENG